MTSIEWTDATWNPTRGCRRISPGCVHCYAERLAIRMSGPGGAYEGLVKMTPYGPRWTGEGRLAPSVLTKPLRMHEPRMFFVDSMSDLFYEQFSDVAIAVVFGVMNACPQHTFQILTKRPERAWRWFMEALARVDIQQVTCETLDKLGWDRGCGSAFEPDDWPLPNVWLGTSTENQAEADKRIPILLACPAAKHFVSYEPALGPLAIRDYMPGSAMARASIHHHRTGHDCGGWGVTAQCQVCTADFDLEAASVDWVICGAESGPGARPMDEQWARQIRDQCVDAGVPFMLKQFATASGKKLSLPLLDGCQWAQIPRGGLEGETDDDKDEEKEEPL